MAQNEEDNQASRTAKLFGCKEKECSYFCWNYDRCALNELWEGYFLEKERFIDELRKKSPVYLSRDDI